ncbi:MAG: pyruvate dehydrogenase (acetyl-transferring), homodimeric type [Chitinophagales bacterium]
MQDAPILNDWQLEQQEWLEALEEIVEAHGKEKSAELFQSLRHWLARKGIANSGSAINTPYLNTLSVDDQPDYPGDLEIEQELENILKWNAQAIVLQAYDKGTALGGHIATYAGAATFIEVLMNHFLRKKSADYGGDTFMIQGHASPGLYARAAMEGRLSEYEIANFRQETIGGVSSYPHPRRMPDFWRVPTVSMGLGPLMAIYQARFQKYLEHRGLKPKNGGKIWHIIGDGEIDEPEILGSINVASGQDLDNLVFIINCNLQRLDGPVRGNGKIIQELERSFLGSGWNTLKLIWGSEWDELFAKDSEGVLLKRLEEMVDGNFQELNTLQNGADIRKKLANGDKKIEALLADYSDEQIKNLRRGGHDREKLYAAFQNALHADKPTVILVKTIKGYGMGKSAEGLNTAHQVKNLQEDDRITTKNGYNIPISDEDALAAKFYFPDADSKVMQYLHEKRKALGGYIPERLDDYPAIEAPDNETLQPLFEGSESSGGKDFSTTAAVVRLLTQLLRKSSIKQYIVPIVPDEAQTFGMESIFNSAKIYNAKGQLYEPLEIGISVIKYKESKTGQVLQEGINEAGATASFIAAGTAYSTHGIPTIPFYIYYSMFGFQRVQDLIWAGADMLAKGFLLGGTAGRTTLNGEGLQHQDGHSHLMALTVPSILSYDPAFAYELAIIVQDGIRRMYVENEKIFYYITVYNENYFMPTMPEGVEEGILKGIYKYKASETKVSKGKKVHLLGSGSGIVQTLQAAEILEEMGISTDIWSVTSWNELYKEATACDRWNMLHPDAKEEKTPYIQQVMKGEEGVFVSNSDWMKLTSGALYPWMPDGFVALGTDGFGLSDSRENLRDYFEVSGKYIAYAALRTLQKKKKVTKKDLLAFMEQHGIESDKIDPMSV